MTQQTPEYRTVWVGNPPSSRELDEVLNDQYADDYEYVNAIVAPLNGDSWLVFRRIHYLPNIEPNRPEYDFSPPKPLI